MDYKKRGEIRAEDYRHAEGVNFRLCVDRNPQSLRKTYRVYCGYAFAFWRFSSMGAAVHSLLTTVEAMRLGVAPENIFTRESGMRPIDDPRLIVWNGSSLHRMQGGLYSAYLYFPLRAGQDRTLGSLSIIESRQAVYSEAFSTPEELTDILRGVGRIYASSQTELERRRKFRERRQHGRATQL